MGWSGLTLSGNWLVYDNLVIRTFQDEILEAIDTILAHNGITLKTYFKTIQPLEFTDTDDIVTEEQRERGKTKWGERKN